MAMHERVEPAEVPAGLPLKSAAAQASRPADLRKSCAKPETRHTLGGAMRQLAPCPTAQRFPQGHGMGQDIAPKPTDRDPE